MLKACSFERDGKRIFGMACLPEAGEGPYPTVIICHGYNGTWDYNLHHAENLCRSGIASYLFDFCGGGLRSRSTGRMTRMSALTEAEDLRLVMDFVKTRDFVDEERIFWLGESQGGLVAALAAPSCRRELRGLILFFPAFMIPAEARERFACPAEIPETLPFLDAVVGRAYYADLLALKVDEMIRGYDGPVLILHGDQDQLVPLAYSRHAQAVYPQAELQVIQGAGHGFCGAHALEAGRCVAGFVRRKGH